VQYIVCDAKRFYDVAHLFSPIGAAFAEDLRCGPTTSAEAASPRFATVPARWVFMMMAVYSVALPDQDDDDNSPLKSISIKRRTG
jgi:hypothetical protein